MKRLPRARCALLILVTLSTSDSLRAEDGGRTRSISFVTRWFDFDRQRVEAFETCLEYRAGRAARRLPGSRAAGPLGRST